MREALFPDKSVINSESKELSFKSASHSKQSDGENLSTHCFGCLLTTIDKYLDLKFGRTGFVKRASVVNPLT